MNKEFYNGMTICVDDGGFPEFVTVGKLYEFVDGVTHFDDGDETTQYYTLEGVNSICGVGAIFAEVEAE